MKRLFRRCCHILVICRFGLASTRLARGLGFRFGVTEIGGNGNRRWQNGKVETGGFIGHVLAMVTARRAIGVAVARWTIICSTLRTVATIIAARAAVFVIGCALRAIIAHCTGAGAGGFTPSDFSGGDVSQTDLDKLFSRLQ